MPALASLYPASLTLSMLAPPGGPAEGGTEVRLFGAGLAALAHHHFRVLVRLRYRYLFAIVHTNSPETLG
jgi:hypothetical protein